MHSQINPPLKKHQCLLSTEFQQDFENSTHCRFRNQMEANTFLEPWQSLETKWNEIKMEGILVKSFPLKGNEMEGRLLDFLILSSPPSTCLLSTDVRFQKSV